MSDPKDGDKKENANGDDIASEKLEPEIIETESDKTEFEELPSSPVSDQEKPQGKPAFLPASLSTGRILYALVVFLLLIFALLMLWPRDEKVDKEPQAGATEEIQFTEEEIGTEDGSEEIAPAKSTEQSNQIFGTDIDASIKPDPELTQTRDRNSQTATTAEDIVEQPAIVVDEERADAERLQLQQEAKIRAEEKMRQRQLEREARIAAATDASPETLTNGQPQSGERSDTALVKDAIAPSITNTPETSTNQVPDGKINNSIVDDIDIDALRTQLRAEVLAEAEAERLQEQQRLHEAQKKIEQLQKELSDAATNRDRQAESRIAELETQLRKIENSAQQQASRTVALSLALDALEEKISRGQPYEEELQVFKQLAPSTYDTTTLEALAASGVTDLRSLQQDYAGFAREALAEIRRKQAKGFFSGLNASLSNMFSLRRVGDVSGDTPSAIIARAEMRLGEGDLETALNELRKLPAPAKEAMAVWRVRAEERLSAEQNIDQLKNRLLRDVQ
jgi:hypothetical protein